MNNSVTKSLNEHQHESTRRHKPKRTLEKLSDNTGTYTELLRLLQTAGNRAASNSIENKRYFQLSIESLGLGYSQGVPLDPSTRAFMEKSFSEDFGDVRIHTGEEADLSALVVGAQAYTVGSDVVFKDGKYSPSTISGKQLLAHELAHVVQQNYRPNSAYASPSVAESEASRAAMQSINEKVSSVESSAVGIQRESASNPVQDILDEFHHIEVQFNTGTLDAQEKEGLLRRAEMLLTSEHLSGQDITDLNIKFNYLISNFMPDQPTTTELNTNDREVSCGNSGAGGMVGVCSPEMESDFKSASHSDLGAMGASGSSSPDMSDKSLTISDENSSSMVTSLDNEEQKAIVRHESMDLQESRVETKSRPKLIGPSGEEVSDDAVNELRENRKLDNITPVTVYGHRLVPGQYNEFLNFTLLSHVGSHLLVERNGKYLAIKVSDVGEYTRLYPAEKGVQSAGWAAYAYPKVLKITGDILVATPAIPLGLILIGIGEEGLRDANEAGIEGAEEWDVPKEQAPLFQMIGSQRKVPPPIHIADVKPDSQSGIKKGHAQFRKWHYPYDVPNSGYKSLWLYDSNGNIRVQIWEAGRYERLVYEEVMPKKVNIKTLPGEFGDAEFGNAIEIRVKKIVSEWIYKKTGQKPRWFPKSSPHATGPDALRRPKPHMPLKIRIK